MLAFRRTGEHTFRRWPKDSDRRLWRARAVELHTCCCALYHLNFNTEEAHINDKWQYQPNKQRDWQPDHGACFDTLAPLHFSSKLATVRFVFCVRCLMGPMRVYTRTGHTLYVSNAISICALFGLLVCVSTHAGQGVHMNLVSLLLRADCVAPTLVA